MTGNTFGKLFQFTSFGESHGSAIGCVVSGCPPGLVLSEADIQSELDRRRPGQSRYVTQRQEPDKVQILSGVFEGKTTGTSIALLIPNQDARSKDYEEIKRCFRPGHADYTYWHKYGHRDYRGGGRSSARETAVRVAAGAIAKKWLAEKFGVQVRGYLSQVGPISLDFCAWETVSTSLFFSPDPDKESELGAYLDQLRQVGESCGAAVTVVGSKIPVGWGDPVYDRLDATLAHAMMGINAVKGVEIGAGFGCVSQLGSEYNDEIGSQGFFSNQSGGILGGISSGQDIVIRLAIKPTSSTWQPRRSIDVEGQDVVVSTKGRHDPCVGIRAVPIAEAMLAVVLMDHALCHRAQCADVDIMTKVLR